MSGLGLFIKSEYANGNKIVYSRVKDHENNMVKCKDLCIKYVIDGNEQYNLNNLNYNVGPGEFMLINADQQHREFVRSKTEVTGICMSLSKNILEDVFTNKIVSTEALLDNPVSYHKSPIDVLEGVYNANESGLGDVFTSLRLNAPNTTFGLSDNFSFYSMVSESLLAGQGIIQEKISHVKAERYITRKELYRRIEIGKKMIDQQFAKHLEIEAIAASSAMSTFHFTRTFKQIYNVSPYQYAIQKRLECAKRYLNQKQYSISEIAFLVGFPDIFTFSKSFKNCFGIPPSKFRANN